MTINALGNAYNHVYDAASKKSSVTGVSENDFAKILNSKEILHSKIKEMQGNIEAGNVDFDPVFQIGGQAYTQEEWEKLLKYVDEVEEETQEAIETEQEQVKEDIDEE